MGQQPKSATDLEAGKQLGKRIAMARRSKGLTQLQLGKACGVAPTTVASWERGDATPGAIRMQEISKALGITVNSLTPHRGGDEPTSEQLGVELVNKLGRRLVNRMLQLTPYALKRAIGAALEDHDARVETPAEERESS